MANKKIRGITVEIGGDVTKLDKALAGSEKQSRSLQVELREIDKLLKFDPTNAELLTQKQSALKDMISETAKKLDTLKEAEAQVIAQFERGEIVEEQLRAFQREIIQTEKALDGMKDDLSAVDTALENVANGTDTAEKHTQEYRDEVEKAKKELEDFGNKAEESLDKVKTGALAIGTAMVATAGYTLKLSTEFDKALNTLITRTGASADEVDELNASMESVYANNFGESIEDVAVSMANVRTNTKLTGQELEDATQYALLMRDTFDFEVNESTRSAKMLMDQYGLSAEEAYNLIAQGAQSGLDKNGDLLDTINEYSVHFKQLGIDAPTMFNMLANGAESGTFSVDKLGDSIKEFGIRVKDGSDATAEGFTTIGLNADEMSRRFSKGGQSAYDALRETAQALFTLEDPLAQNQAGVALFGTMWEDLGVEGMMALMSLDGKISESNDALSKINEQKYDDIGSALQGLGRTLETDLINPIGEELTPVVSDVIDTIKENAPEIKEVISTVVDKVGEFVTFVSDNGSEIISVIAGIGAGFVAWNVATTIMGVVEAIKKFKTATEGASIAMKIFNAVGKANVFILIASLIATVIVALVTFLATNEDARAKIVEVWGKIKETFSNVINAIVGFFTTTIPEAFSSFITKVEEFFSKIGSFISEKFESFKVFVNTFLESIKNFFVNAGNNIVNFFTTTIPNLITSIVGWFNQLPEKIGYAIGFVIGKLILWATNVKTWITTEVPKIITSVVNFFKTLPSKIYEAIIGAVNRVATWATNLQNKAVSGVTSLINSVVTFFKTLPSKIYNAIVSAIDKVSSWGSKMKTKASTAISNLVTSVTTTAKALPGKIYSAISGAINKVVTWGTNMKNKAVSGMKNVVKGITDSFKNLPTKMASIGKNIVEGVWNGIKNATSWIKDKVASFASSILEGMKDALDINSPSRIFRDQVGRFIAEGIGVGIEENEDSPLQALEKLGDDMINGGKKINGITLNRQLEHTFTNNMSSGGSVADLVNLVSEYFPKLIEASNKSIYLNGKTLVGETINDIDSALGTIYAMKARGT